MGPAIANIFAPTHKTNPSAAVNIGHSNLKNIYIKPAVWYNEIKERDIRGLISFSGNTTNSKNLKIKQYLPVYILSKKTNRFYMLSAIMREIGNFYVEIITQQKTPE